MLFCYVQSNVELTTKSSVESTMACIVQSNVMMRLMMIMVMMVMMVMAVMMVMVMVMLGGRTRGNRGSGACISTSHCNLCGPQGLISVTNDVGSCMSVRSLYG